MKLRRSVVAALVVAASVLGVTATPAQSANLLCPQLCLTGGILGLGGARVSVQAVETRTYEFSWTAIDLTDEVPIQETLHVTIEATGTTVNGVWTGTNGSAYIEDLETFNSAEVDNITIREAAGLVLANGSDGSESFQLQGTILGGGIARYQSEFDHNWDYAA